MKTLMRLGLAAILYGGAIGMMHGWESRHAATEYLAVPPAGTMRVLGAGYDNVLADGLYLQFVNYFGKHMARDKAYLNLAPTLDAMTALDPYFQAPYRLGALALGDAHQIDQLDLFLAQGSRRFPGDWEMQYDCGMGLFVFAETQDQFMKAAEYFRRAAALPGAPPKAAFMLARAYHVADRRDLVVAIWRDLYAHSPSLEARTVAKRSLARLGETPTPPSK